MAGNDFGGFDSGFGQGSTPPQAPGFEQMNQEFYQSAQQPYQGQGFGQPQYSGFEQNQGFGQPDQGFGQPAQGFGQPDQGLGSQLRNGRAYTDQEWAGMLRMGEPFSTDRPVWRSKSTQTAS